MTLMYHHPVLLQSVIKYLVTNYKGIYVDCTFGGGGHSREILKKLDKNAKLIAFDFDEDSKKNLLCDNRFLFFSQNFKDIKYYLYLHKIYKVDGIFADFGVSSYQLDNGSRGFSTRFDGPLNMRMNNNQSLSAFEVVNHYEEKYLRNIFFKYGELNYANKIAKKICQYRSKKLIQTTDELKNIFYYMPKNKINKILARIFQSIRIEVNDELNSIKKLLISAKDLLQPSGRLVMIAYHSLEDRLVKNFFKTGDFINYENPKDVFGNSIFNIKSLFKKPIRPNIHEINLNPRCRSAKLRVGIKI